MFQTSKGMRLSMPDELQLESTQHWHTIKQTLPSCWFHIHYLDHAMEHESVLFTGEIDCLIAVAKNHGISLLGISLASPPQLNKQGSWLLSPLEEIYEYSTEQSGEKMLFGYEYRLESGQVLVEHWIEQLHLKPSDIKLVFSSPIKRSTPEKCQFRKQLTNT